MRTGSQQRYFDVLRREDHRKRHGTTMTASSSGASQKTAAAPTSSASTVWDPIEGLQLDSTTVVAMRELVCDHRSLTALHQNFLRFEQLDALVLDHNALRTLHNLLPPSHLSGLSSTASSASSASAGAATRSATASAATASLYSGCRRLTRLHVSHNNISDVARDTDIPRLLLLEHLSLAFNALTDLDAVLRPLYRLRHLRYLDLRGNPLVDEPSYRQRCVAGLPQVEVLDGLTVTAEERRNTSKVNGMAKSRVWNSAPEENEEGSMRFSGHKKCEGTARGRFAKSAIARDLDLKYAAHLREEEERKVAAIEARAAVDREKAETREAFHAVWTLSQTGMPLSEDSWRAVVAAAGTGAHPPSSAMSGGHSAGEAAAAGAASSVANAASPTGTGRAPRQARKPPTQQSLSASLAGRPRTPLCARTSAQLSPPPENVGGCANGAGSSSSSSAEVKYIGVPRDRLLPALAASSPPPPASSTQSTLRRTGGGVAEARLMQQQQQQQQYDSPYFRTVRGSQDGTTGDYAMSLSRAARDPSPARLAALQDALHASATILRSAQSSARHGTVAEVLDGPLMPLPNTTTSNNAINSSPSATERRRSAGLGASPAPAPVPVPVPMVPVNLHALRVVQHNSYAVIPPPWEREEGEAAAAAESSGRGRTDQPALAAKVIMSSSLGRVQANTLVQEALVEVLVLLHQLFSAEELQLLEMEYGKAELLRLLPVPGWTAARDASSGQAATQSNTLLAARQEMRQLLGPGTSTGANGSSAAGRRAGGGGGDDRKKSSAVAGGKGGGGIGNSTSAGAVSGTATSGNSLTSGEVAAAAMAAARAVLPTDPAQVWALFFQPFLLTSGSTATVPSAGKSGEGAASGRNGSAGNAVNGATSGGAAVSSAAAAGGGASSPVSAEDVSVHDPEAMQHLVRPIGPYEARVLSSLLKLLKPSPSLDPAALCDGLRVLHTVGQHTANANVAACAASAAVSEASRGGQAAGKGKKEASPPAPEGDSGEGKKKGGKSSIGTSLAHSTTAASSTGVAASGVRDHNVQARASPSLTPQVTLLAVLTALLFHPGFVRERLQNWEQELVQKTMAAVAEAPTTVAINTTPTARGDAVVNGASPGTKGGASANTGVNASSSSSAGVTAAPSSPSPTPLSRLFHRVQALKTHAARVEAAAAAAASKEQAAEATKPCFVNPVDVLKAWQ